MERIVDRIQENEQVEVEKISNAINQTSAISKSIITSLHRDFLDNASYVHSIYSEGVPFFEANYSWIEITQIGIDPDAKPEKYFKALQNIMQACCRPDTDLVFLIFRTKQKYRIFIGLHGDGNENAIIELRAFLLSSWKGIKCSFLSRDYNQDGYPYQDLLEFKAHEFKKIYSITGVPTQDFSSGYPTTLEYLMSSDVYGDFAYMVIATPVPKDDIETQIDSCRDALGLQQTIRARSLSATERRGRSVSKTKQKGKQTGYGTFDSIYGGIHAGAAMFGVNIGGSSGESHNTSKNKTHGITKGMSSDFSKTLGYTIINSHVETAIEELKKYDKRLSMGSDVGMWKVGAYLFLGDEYSTYPMQLRSLLSSGKESSNEPIRLHSIGEILPSRTIQTQKEINGKIYQCSERQNSFISNPDIFAVLTSEDDKKFEPLLTYLTTSELTSLINLPLHSVPGITAREVPAFGRNIPVENIGECKNESAILGHLNYLGDDLKNETIALNWNDLTSHTFITGSTGSGKSTVIYKLLLSAVESNRTFLVIEPAKGEYKTIFGNGIKIPQTTHSIIKVRVLSTNPNISELLRLNPFSFPGYITVEEHIEKLTDIFNACWPMYAAMPSVLKSSIINAYISCGWDIATSSSTYGIFPTFQDVIREMNAFINSSDYSSETKGDYKGALVTRLSSMTNGTIGRVCCGNDIPSDKLFNSNVIIDLSRVGSSETKSLLMGFIILKLDEFRKVEGKGTNLPLRHITVLEEAHHLLRRSSPIQSQESANLQGKSVEMLTTSIAEMRTYGEGFIIADQSPSLLDHSVLSNTNTKIILNLPDRMDRDLAGDTIGLTEVQKREVSKLERGVAVVCQRGWEEAVLCRVTPFNGTNTGKWQYHPFPVIDNKFKDFMEIIDSNHLGDEIPIDRLRDIVYNLQLAGHNKFRALQLIDQSKYCDNIILSRVVNYVIGQEIFLGASQIRDNETRMAYLLKSIKESSNVIISRLPSLLYMYMKGQYENDHKSELFETWFISCEKTIQKQILYL